MEGLVNTLYKVGMNTQNYIFSHVYGVPRGGLPIAAHLSHNMNLDLLEDITGWQMHVPLNGLNLLVVDDVVDTGETFSYLSEELLSYADDCLTFNYKFLSIHYKPRSKFKPDIFFQEVNNSTWVVYPWECDDKRCELDKVDFQERRGLTTSQKAM